MNLILIITISALVSAGVYLSLSKDLLRTIIGLAILGTAANLVVFYSGHPGTLVSAIIDTGLTALPADAANPLPQALVLTAIVIGFALLCFALVLMVVIAKQTQTRQTDVLQHNEPATNAKTDPLKPSIMESE